MSSIDSIRDKNDNELLEELSNINRDLLDLRFKLETKQFIRRPLEEVFGFFSRPENLVVITPAKLHFKILTPSLPTPHFSGRL